MTAGSAALTPIVTARKLTIATATLITAISVAVAKVAPALPGADARAVIIALFSWAFDTYLVGLLPLWLRPYAGFIKGSAIQGLETAYRAVVKPSK